MKFLILIKSVIILYFILCLTLFFSQKLLIYRPTKDIPHKFETFKLINQGVEIESIVTKSSTNDVILYFGGNAENVAFTASDFAAYFINQSTYLLKYRGYSGAKGNPEEQVLYSDALAIYDAAIKKHNGKITIIGRSLGSAIATYLASERNIDQLILITPFDSIADVAKDLLPILPIDWLLTERFDSKSRAHKIDAPTLVIIAENDEVIPRSRTNHLIKSLPEKNHRVINIKAGHNDIDLKPSFHKQLQQFINAN